jgi:chromosome segregation ATPase
MDSSQIDAYTGKLNAQLKEWNAKVEELRAKGQSASVEAKVQLNKQLEDLATKRAAAEKKLRELQAAGAEKFQVLKQGVDQAWHDLRGALEKVTKTPGA